MEPGQWKHLTEAVAAWLQFEVLCDREDYLSEASLCFPMVQFVSAHGCRLKPEPSHEGVVPKRGRPLSFDYAWRCGVAKGPDGYIEVKWNSWQSAILNDVARLLEARGERFMLVAGTRERKKIEKLKHDLEPFLSFDLNKPDRRAQNDSRDWKTFEDASKEFRKQRKGLGKGIYSNAFSTRLVGIAEVFAGSTLITIALWKVQKRSFAASPRHPETQQPPLEEDKVDLRQQLRSYLSKPDVTPKRVRDILLPLCLDHEPVTRAQLMEKKLTGRQVGNISRAANVPPLGQVLQYDPLGNGRKDSYRFQHTPDSKGETCKEMVRKVLEELKRAGA